MSSLASQQHDGRDVLDAVLRGAILVEDEVHFFDRDLSRSATRPRRGSACAIERGVRSADGLGEEEQRDRMFDGGQPLRTICRSGLEQRHVGYAPGGPDPVSELNRSSNAFRASSVRGVVVSRSTVLRGA